MKKLIAIFTAALLATGCAAPTGAGGGALHIDDFGPRPSDITALDASAKRWMAQRLKDPYSMQMERIGGPAPFTKKASLLGPSSYGWGVCYTVNAKNSFGGYVGARPVMFVFRDGAIVDVIGGAESGIEGSMGRIACEKLGMG